MITTRTANAFVSHEFPSDSLPILRGQKYDLVGEEVDSLRLLVHRVRLFREWIGVLEGIANSLLEEGGDFFRHLITFDGEETMISESADVPLFNAWGKILQYPDTEVDLSDGEALAGKWEMEDLETETHWESEMKNCATIAAHLTIQSLRLSNNTHPFAPQLLDYTAHLSGNMGNRRLILVHDKTLDATLPGTAFHTAQIDDFVVLLEGSTCPVALRQQEGELWSFVGPAYVSGFMDGEAWPDEDEEVELQEFVLI